MVALSATKIDSSEEIRAIEPEKRNCRFPDEKEILRIHRSYTQTNCMLECALFYARSKFQAHYNFTCTPWHLPFVDRLEQVCDPWSSSIFHKIMSKNKTNRDCSHCLPACTNTIYHVAITTAPFRVCDNSNIGVSQFCNFEDSLFPEPQIWARQARNEYADVFPLPDYISNLTSSERTYDRSPAVFPKLPKTYDAYDKDIAVVQVSISFLRLPSQKLDHFEK